MLSVFGGAALAAGLLAGCSGDSASTRPTGAPAPTAPLNGIGVDPSTTGAPGGTSTPPTAAPEPVLPAVDLVDVATGDTVSMQRLLPSDKPLLAWFWAPH